MKPRTRLAEATTPDGLVLSLFEHDGDFSMSLNGQELMHSRASASEELLGTLGVERLVGKPDGPEPFRILVGGLGLGFTLRSVLEACSEDGRVDVVELIPEVIDWNRTHLKELNGFLLDDSRVEIHLADVGAVIREAGKSAYDAILLDVDNGPVAMVKKTNKSLYSSAGIRSIRAALKPGGRAVLWSAGPDKAFAERLEQAGFQVRAVPAKVHERAKRAAYVLYVADLR
jgi:spermidine synthase